MGRPTHLSFEAVDVVVGKWWCRRRYLSFNFTILKTFQGTRAVISTIFLFVGQRISKTFLTYATYIYIWTADTHTHRDKVHSRKYVPHIAHIAKVKTSLSKLYHRQQWKEKNFQPVYRTSREDKILFKLLLLKFSVQSLVRLAQFYRRTILRIHY